MQEAGSPGLCQRHIRLWIQKIKTEKKVISSGVHVQSTAQVYSISLLMRDSFDWRIKILSSFNIQKRAVVSWPKRREKKRNRKRKRKIQSGCAINRVVRMLPDPGAPADSAASHANTTRSKGIKSKNAKKILSIICSITCTPSCYSIKSSALATVQTPKPYNCKEIRAEEEEKANKTSSMSFQVLRVLLPNGVPTGPYSSVFIRKCPDAWFPEPSAVFMGQLE